MALDPSQALFARDFFFEVMKDSQRLRSGYLAERETWLRGLAVEGREEVLFEFEMLLRGLERYFNVHNLLLDGRQNLMERDFREELRTVRDGVDRAIHLTQFLLDANADRNLVFRKYVETQLADDRTRGRLLEQQLTQETPQESLFLLRSGFSALRGVVDGLLRLPHVSYQVFTDLGQLTVREIALNKYFRPFRPLEFRGEYDRIKSVRILDVLRQMQGGGDQLRRTVSLAFLALFRLVHYLRYIPSGADDAARRGYLVLALVKSEAGALAVFLEGELAATLSAAGVGQTNNSTARIALEIRKEVGKVLKRHLAGAAAGDLDTIARARDALSALFKQWVASLAQVFEPTVNGREIFDDYVSRLEQARRLRTDLWAFREICHRAERAALRGSSDEVERAVGALRKFVGYFKDVSYQLLRYGDYEPFDRFINILNELEPGRLSQVKGRRQLTHDCRAFGEVLAKTFGMVSKREEIDKLPFDDAEGKAVLVQMGLT
jgi:hypothetical protein